MFLSDLLSVIDAGNNALLVLLDLSAAFDTVDHSPLKMLHDELFVLGTVLEWFTSHLSCGFQQVLVGQSYLAETPFLCSIPQGLAFGPVLFSLHTRQLAGLIHKHSIDYRLFADDFELCSCLPVERESAPQAIRNMESCRNEIRRWINENQLKLNEHKTEVLVSGPSCEREGVPVDKLAVGDARIQFSSAVKLSGGTS